MKTPSDQTAAEVTDILAETFGPDLAAKMRANAEATSRPCPTCGAGRGRQCIGTPSGAAHPERDCAHAVDSDCPHYS